VSEYLLACTASMHERIALCPSTELLHLLCHTCRVAPVVSLQVAVRVQVQADAADAAAADHVRTRTVQAGHAARVSGWGSMRTQPYR
jgi:hypothetical protein